MPEGTRATASELPLLAILFIKEDWAEYANTLGFPTWASLQNPCPMCRSTLASVYDLGGVSVLSLPWPQKTYADYVAACNLCEVWVDVSDDDWRMIRASLAYDKRNSKGSSRGRALQADYPSLGLIKGDRLEPCAQVPDIGAGFDAENPGRALF